MKPDLQTQITKLENELLKLSQEEIAMEHAVQVLKAQVEVLNNLVPTPDIFKVLRITHLGVFAFNEEFGTIKDAFAFAREEKAKFTLETFAIIGTFCY